MQGDGGLRGISGGAEGAGVGAAIAGIGPAVAGLPPNLPLVGRHRGIYGAGVRVGGVAVTPRLAPRDSDHNLDHGGERSQVLAARAASLSSRETAYSGVGRAEHGEEREVAAAVRVTGAAGGAAVASELVFARGGGSGEVHESYGAGLGGGYTDCWQAGVRCVFTGVAQTRLGLAGVV